MYEVEIKASLAGLTKEQLRAAAEKKGFSQVRTLQETDLYFNGNDRDFRKTDEALRLRSCRNLSEEKGEQTLVTYKGPKLDERSSSRMEHETAVGEFVVMKDLLTALGYKAMFTVEKNREEFTLTESGKTPGITLCLDTVTGLGDYMELETLAPSKEKKQQAVEQLLQLMESLGVPQENMTRKSYLELLVFSSK